MKSSDIIHQLRNQLLLHTNLFSDELSIVSLTRAGGLATAVVSSSSNFKSGQDVTITGAFYKNNILSISQNGKTITVITKYIHNLTLDFHKYVDIQGSTNNSVNGKFQLISVPNSNCFEYVLPVADPLDFSGDIYLKDNFSYMSFNGRHKIDVISPTKFTYPIGDIGPEDAIGDISVRFNPRISGAVSTQRAVGSYTAKKDNELWAYVILGNSFVSKSRHIENDATDYIGAGAIYRQRSISEFSILVFSSTRNEISGRRARDLMQDIEVHFGKSLLLYTPPKRFSESVLSGIVSLGTSFELDSTSFYVHSFNYESTEDIVFSDTISIESASMRALDLEFLNKNDNIIMQTDDISLEEVDKQ